MAELLHVLLDQNVPRAIAPWLRSIRPDWDIWHTSEVGLNSQPDETVLAWAQSHQAVVVITFDEDFTDSRRVSTESLYGIIRLRVWPTTIEETQSALGRLLDQVPEEQLSGSLIIIGKQHMRIRRIRKVQS